MTFMSSSVSMPHCSLTLPFSWFQLPLRMSRFMANLLTPGCSGPSASWSIFTLRTLADPVERQPPDEGRFTHELSDSLGVDRPRLFSWLARLTAELWEADLKSA